MQIAGQGARLAEYGDRYAMVGDAAGLVRAFKGKGVTSAVLTGIWAAQIIYPMGRTRARVRPEREPLLS